MFAVSTTGFAKGAHQYAQEKGVVLRTVEAISDIASDFTIETIKHVVFDVLPIGRIDIITANPDDKPNLTAGAKFKTPNRTNFQTLQDFVLEFLQPKLNCEQNSEENCIFEYKDSLDMLASEELFKINYLRIPLRIKVRVYRDKILAAKRYSEGNKIIGAEGTAEAVTPHGKLKVKVQLFKKSDGTEDIKVYLPDNLPSGWYVSEVSLGERRIKIQH